MAWSERFGKYRIMRVRIPCHPVTTQLCIFASTHNSLTYTLCWPQLRFDQPTPRSGSITTDSAAHCASWMPLCFPYDYSPNTVLLRSLIHQQFIDGGARIKVCSYSNYDRVGRSLTAKLSLLLLKYLEISFCSVIDLRVYITLLVHQQLRNRFNKT